MDTKKLIAEISKPTFYNRVAFMALIQAQNVSSEAEDTPNHDRRVAYAGRIFRGEESIMMLANHIVASNATIQQEIIDGSSDDVPDAHLEFAFGSIWDARANAFYTPPVVIEVPAQTETPTEE